ncbi:MAG: zinc ABC transporter substrate-binding protein [Thermotogae bacterium]|nr:zinc ABC transporter substrate-binding protein [Thermotogota bacterium]
MRRSLLLLALVALSCGPQRERTVVLSNVPMYSVALDLCGECDYHVIVRGGGHMHLYEPTPKDHAKALSGCAFLRVAKLDEWARGWKAITIHLEDPHFWLYRDGVLAVADSLDAALRRCQSDRYAPENLSNFKGTVDSLFSVRLEGEVCASSILVSRFLSNYGIKVRCLLQSNEFREPSADEVRRFVSEAERVGVVVRDTGDVLPPLPDGVKVITIRLHPAYGERYTDFLARNLELVGTLRHEGTLRP